MRRTKWMLLALGAISVSTLFGCGKDEETGPTAPNSGTFVGETKTLGAGTARSWVMLDAGKPTTVGVTLTAAALTGLPAVETEVALLLPSQAGATAFNHVGLNWNPQGHEPPGVYDVPHFDVHFYRITQQARQSITAVDADTVNIMNLPGTTFRPPDYAPGPGGVPRMGLHWVDTMSPELQGQPFTRTFIYGSYSGSFIFWEPMLTLAYLQTHPIETLTLKLPEKYPQAGRYYPTQYSVKFDPTAQEYTVAIEWLVLRQ